MERGAHLRDVIRPLRSSYMDCKLLLILFPVGCGTWKEQSGLPLCYCQSGEFQHLCTLTKSGRFSEIMEIQRQITMFKKMKRYSSTTKHATNECNICIWDCFLSFLYDCQQNVITLKKSVSVISKN